MTVAVTNKWKLVLALLLLVPIPLPLSNTFEIQLVSVESIALKKVAVSQVVKSGLLDLDRGWEEEVKTDLEGKVQINQRWAIRPLLNYLIVGAVNLVSTFPHGGLEGYRKIYVHLDNCVVPLYKLDSIENESKKKVVIDVTGCQHKY